MKRLLSVILILVLATASPVVARAQENISISVKKMELVHGDTFTLKLLNAKEKTTIVWNTTNKNVATVSSEGVVSADNCGKAIITAKVGSKKYTCKITVIENINNMRPYDAYNFASLDIIGYGFFVLDNYTRFGECSYGEDFNTTIENLEKNMTKLLQYNDKIIAMEGEEYDDFKSAWKLVYNELNSLYNEMANNPPTTEITKRKTEWLNFKTIDKYLRSLAKECSYFG